ncbi:MAG: sigma-70 family RNA polymerase sigma factor [Bacteroidota bacterium]|nr:sigma-70 family RNA polymerase sigma factor [Bacteroidota bacterium]
MENLKKLIQGAKRNDQKSFKVLFDLYWDSLYSYMLKTIQNEEIAEDITVKAFAKAFDKINSFDSNYKFKTWLLTISKNLYKDFLREKNKISKIRTSPLNPKSKDYPTSISPEEIIINTQKLEHILESIKSLKNEYKKILRLRFFEGLSYKEISKKLNQPLNTIKVKILRAKNILNSKINAENEY